MKTIIAAIGRNNELGANNDLLWHLPADFAHFKQTTMGGSLIMGYKTFLSMNSRPLPNRENIVLNSDPVGINGVLTALSLDAAYALARYPVFIIGGGSVYAQTIDDVDKLVITHVDADFPQATIFFPAIDPAKWREASREHHDADERNDFAFDIVTYEKAA